MHKKVYKQGDIIVVRYPLSDKPGKTIIRPGIIISNENSNHFDKDVLVCQITTNLRNTEFSFLLEDTLLTIPIPQICEAKCNKIATVRIWDTFTINKISALKPEGLKTLLQIVKTVFN